MSLYILFAPAIWVLTRLTLAGKLIAMFLGVATVLACVATASALISTSAGWVAAVVSAALAAYWFGAFHRSFVTGLRALGKVMEQAAEGDLRTRASLGGRDELADLSRSLDRMVHSLSTMVAEVRSNAALVAHSGATLATGNRELSDRTEQQAASLEQTAASVAEISGTVVTNADIARQSDARAGVVRAAADSCTEAMAKAVDSVEAIQQGARRMSEIVGVIDSLAFQTNILALNAAVEAARAGDQGRGFAVVAAEVRTLAQRSAASAREIRQLIGTSTAQVESSAGLIRSAGEGFREVADGIRTVANNLSEISTSSAQQSGGLLEIATAVQQLDRLTQQNAQMVERTLEQSVGLEHRAATLSEAVQDFKLQQGTASEAIALVEAAVRLSVKLSTPELLKRLTDAAQPFHDRDMYVFVFDRQGHYRAFAGNPAKIGTRVQDIPGVDGSGLIRAVFAQAADGPGWVEYGITNPTTGAVQTKMSFVHPIGDDLVLGCGVYKRLVPA